MHAAAPNLRCWLMLCSDLAIRSGTAARIGPANYDRKAGTLQFRTKLQSVQTLPITAELAMLISQCHDATLPFVAQLARGHHPRSGGVLPGIDRMTPSGLNTAFRRLKSSLGIKRRLTPHDLRRTTVRRVYDVTHDLRTAQSLLGHTALRSTLWYLQADAKPVDLSILELAKLPTKTKGVQ